MQVTTNVVTLPKAVIDAYLDTLSASIDPILKEEDMPAKVQLQLLTNARMACDKSICVKHMKEIEAAGLFDGVVSIDFPGFKWTRGSKFVYAMEMIVPCIVKSLAEEMVREPRDISQYLDFLEAWHSIAVDKATGETLEGAEGPSARRLEEHALGLSEANFRMMVGETPTNILRVLNNVKCNLEMQVDTPLDTLELDLQYLVPLPVVYL